MKPMNTIRNSRLLKLLLQIILFVSGGLALIGIYHLNTYAEKYPYEAASFLETSDFQSKFLKYVERTAVYVRYRESGYTPQESSLYTAADLSSILTGAAAGTILPAESVHVASQESFEYYNYLLNDCNTNFLYFVENLSTGAKYCSPYLASLAGGIDKVEAYLNNLKNTSAYLKLNTQSKRFVTNINRNYNYLNEDNINWVINYLLDGLESSSMVGSPTYKEASDNLTITFDNSLSPSSGIEYEAGSDSESEYALYAYVLDTFPFTEDEFHPMYQEFTRLRGLFDQWIYYTPVAIACFLLSLVFVVFCAGHSRKSEGICLSGFDRFYTELSAAVIGSIIVLILAASSYTNGFYHAILGFGEEFNIAVLYVLLFPVVSFGFVSLIRRIKARSLIRDSVLYRILHGIGCFFRQFLLHRSLTLRVVLLLAVFCLVHTASLYCILETHNLFLLLVMLLDYLFLAAVLIKLAIDLNGIMTETKKISEGDINHTIATEHMISPSRELGLYINNIREGFSGAIEERLKSERLKTELITNVSHDIKTPLTSIINYVDLLNKQPLNNETAKGYLDILTEKSWRLKNLIDDLVEASKASSGTLALHFERINVGELLKQAAGEFEDRFLERGLELVMNLSEEPLYVMADGRSTYRIIENLFSNVTKYALSGTRVYVDMARNQDKVLIAVKNISAAKLGDITGDELMERFVRGDTSRNTEGSGLGLSIAKSLAQLQHGTFELVLDGDLFKALFTLPLCEPPARTSDFTDLPPIWDDTSESALSAADAKTSVPSVSPALTGPDAKDSAALESVEDMNSSLLKL